MYKITEIVSTAVIPYRNRSLQKSLVHMGDGKNYYLIVDDFSAEVKYALVAVVTDSEFRSFYYLPNQVDVAEDGVYILHFDEVRKTVPLEYEAFVEHNKVSGVRIKFIPLKFIVAEMHM